MKEYYLSVLFALLSAIGQCQSLLIPMDEGQKNHLKAYGIAYFALQESIEVDWLLNFRGGSFLTPYSTTLEYECLARGVSFERITQSKKTSILLEISSPAVNMEVVRLQTAPRIGVYSIKNEFVQDETDAVIAVLDFAEIPYTIIYDDEVLQDKLVLYDWLHLHHEDFTGQHWRFRWRPSAILESKMQQATATRLGYSSVSKMKFAVTKKIEAFCSGGGYLFAMCSGAETFDIALAADGMEFIEGEEDDEYPEIQTKLDFTKTLAFENFVLDHSNSRRFSDINTGRPDFYERNVDYFRLFNFSAKWDVVPTMLTQDHEHVIKEFTGQTTSFNKDVVKPGVLVLAENSRANNVRYL